MAKKKKKARGSKNAARWTSSVPDVIEGHKWGGESNALYKAKLEDRKRELKKGKRSYSEAHLGPKSEASKKAASKVKRKPPKSGDKLPKDFEFLKSAKNAKGKSQNEVFESAAKKLMGAGRMSRRTLGQLRRVLPGAAGAAAAVASGADPLEALGVVGKAGAPTTKKPKWKKPPGSRYEKPKKKSKKKGKKK